MFKIIFILSPFDISIDDIQISIEASNSGIEFLLTESFFEFLQIDLPVVRNEGRVILIHVEVQNALSVDVGRIVVD